MNAFEQQAMYETALRQIAHDRAVRDKAERDARVRQATFETALQQIAAERDAQRVKP